VVVCRGRVDASELGYCEHAMHAGGRDRLDHAAGADVKDEQLVGVRVRNVEPVRARIEARVVEADALTW
jgi:hypothetical protein